MLNKWCKVCDVVCEVRNVVVQCKVYGVKCGHGKNVCGVKYAY